MKHLICCLIVMLVFTGCKSVKPMRDTVKTVTENTRTDVRYITQIDTIKIASDVVKIHIPLKKLGETPISKTSDNGRATATISKKNEDLEVICECAEELRIIETQNKIIETLTEKLETVDNTVTIIEYKTPWYAKALSTIGIATIIVVIFGLGSKYLKPSR